MKYFASLFFKGIAMGAANVIPGVSGGTIAFITGIFEELIEAIKSVNIKALKLLFSGKFREFSKYIHLPFLITIFLGVGISILSFAKLFEFLFENYPIYIWSYFFGLILASVFFVGKTIEHWNFSVFVAFIVGTAIAVAISMLNPTAENRDFLYLFICGIVAICSMILPGLSGSFVLILMGNYELIVIEAVTKLDFSILLPVLLGAVFGLIAFSHLLSWIFKHFRFQTISLLTGFILGSLGILWPWKTPIFRYTEFGNELLTKDGKPIIEGYVRFFPESVTIEVLIATGFIILGIVTIWAIEHFADNKNKKVPTTIAMN